MYKRINVQKKKGAAGNALRTGQKKETRHKVFGRAGGRKEQQSRYHMIYAHTSFPYAKCLNIYIDLLGTRYQTPGMHYIM